MLYILVCSTVCSAVYAYVRMYDVRTCVCVISVHMTNVNICKYVCLYACICDVYHVYASTHVQ